MADQIRATPQNATLGAIANLLKQTYAPQRTQQMQGMMEFLGLPALARTVERVSYGEPVTNINKANVPLLPADTAEAAMLAGPPLASLAKRVGTNLVQTAPFVARDMAQSMSSPLRSYVVKPKGGNWLAGSVERAVEPMRAPVRSQDFLGRIADEEARGLTQPGMLDSVLQQNSKAEAINKWLETKLGKYMKNEMATPEDPVRALAERGILHVDPEQLNFRPELHGRFMSEGQTAVAQSPAAKSWEGASDLTLGQMPAGQLLQQGYAEQMPWLAKVPPETPVYMPSQSGMADDLGFGHLVDELRNAINPESGLPANLRLKYQDLEKVTVPQAVERVAKINDWRAAQKAEADMARAGNAATQVVKEYPEQGMKWVELRKPESTGKKATVERSELDELGMGVDDATIREVAEDMAFDEGLEEGTQAFNDFVNQTIRFHNTKVPVEVDESIKTLEDALKYEGETMGHCVGGYCPDVVEGRSRIYSLRDKKGQPHVTIEVKPGNLDHGLWYQSQPQEVKDALNAEGYMGYNVRYSPQFKEAQASAPEEIVQIKGKGNKAPKEDYLPAVQDFVRSGNFGKVGDLQNTGLVKFGNEYRLPSDFLYRSDEGEWVNLQDAAKQYFPDSPTKQKNFITGAMGEPQSIKLISKEEGLAGGGAVQGYAAGGLVDDANSPTGDFDPARIDAMVSDLYAMNTV